MTGYIQLQSVGKVTGTPAKTLQVGDVTMWNFGGLEQITSVTFSASGKTLTVGVRYRDYNGELKEASRKLRAERLVAVTNELRHRFPQ